MPQGNTLMPKVYHSSASVPSLHMLRSVPPEAGLLCCRNVPHFRMHMSDVCAPHDYLLVYEMSTFFLQMHGLAELLMPV